MLFYKFFCQTPLTGVGHPCRSPIVRGCWPTDTEKWWKFCHNVGHLVGHLQVGDRPSVTYEGKMLTWRHFHHFSIFHEGIFITSILFCLHVGRRPSAVGCRPSACRSAFIEGSFITPFLQSSEQLLQDWFAQFSILWLRLVYNHA